jgi:putative transposase
LILTHVRAVRRRHAQIGARKILQMIGADLLKQQITIGRDEFYRLLKAHGLLAKPAGSFVPRTTDSRHRLHVYQNRLKDLQLSAAHQAWVSDITYISVGDSWQYLALITDAFSRRVVGYDLSSSLSIDGSLRALEMAIKQLPTDLATPPMHHSDRGVQYCSHDYINRLRGSGIAISMAAVGNPYENAKAERLNGILKHEYLLAARFPSPREARRAVAEAIHLYNTERPHLALNFNTPDQVHAAWRLPIAA